MKKLTREQIVALKRVYDRGPVMSPADDRQYSRAMTYREFRRTAQNGFDCLMVPWAGMWLGIETDGYTHS